MLSLLVSWLGENVIFAGAGAGGVGICMSVVGIAIKMVVSAGGVPEVAVVTD